MSGKKFTIPSNFDELRVVTDENRYTVSEEYSVREIADYLDGKQFVFVAISIQL